MRVKKSTIKFIISVLVIIAVVLIGYYSLPLLLKVFKYLVKLFLPFVLGYLFSIIAKPLVKFLQKWLKLPKGVAAVAVMIFILGILGSIIGSVVYKIADEIKEIYLKIQKNSDAIGAYMQELTEQTTTLFNRMHPSIQEAIVGWSEDVMNLINTSPEPVVGYAGGFAKALPDVFIGTIVFLLSTFFILSDFEFISGTVKKMFKGSALEKFERVKLELKNYLGGYVKAQFIIMSIAFSIMFISFWLLGVNYGLIIALGIAILDALPFFGSGAALWPWSVISFASGDIERGFGLIIIYVIIVITRQVIEPKIVSSKVGMHPLLTLMAMYVGYKTLSIGGMIFGPVILMILISFYKAGVFDALIGFVRGVLLFLKSEFIIIKNYIKELGKDE